MSLCDTCISPGRCCKDLHLTGGAYDNRAEVPRSFEAAEHWAMREGLPFRPLRMDIHHGQLSWRWWCPALTSEGRCSIYENRPQLCKSFVAGSDPLCVHYWEDPRGEEERVKAPAEHCESVEG